MADAAPDLINHPPHYTAGTIECITYIEDRGWSEGFCLGNATKYMHRAGHKDGADKIQDLLKAQWYLNRYIYFLAQSQSTKDREP